MRNTQNRRMNAADSPKSHIGEDGSYRADCDAQKRQTCSHGRNSCDTGPQASEAFVVEAHGPYDFEDASGEKDDPGHSVTYPGGNAI